MMKALPGIDKVIDATHSDVVQATVNASNTVAELHCLNVTKILSVCLH